MCYVQEKKKKGGGEMKHEGSLSKDTRIYF